MTFENSNIITRESYRIKRVELLREFIDIQESIGLEVGASDLPTVQELYGNCKYADYRTKEEMIEIWNLDPAEVPAIDFIIERNRSLPAQINDRFD